MNINNEFDMFRVLLEKAEKKEVDKEPAKEFFEGVKQLSSVLSFVKMKETEDGLLFERGFDSVKVIVSDGDQEIVTLSYEKVDGFKEYRDKLCSDYEDKTKTLREAHNVAVSKFALW